jgi:hypothetical protein
MEGQCNMTTKSHNQNIMKTLTIITIYLAIAVITAAAPVIVGGIVLAGIVLHTAINWNK